MAATLKNAPRLAMSTSSPAWDRAMIEVPPPAHDADMLQQFARIGIGPGLDVEAPRGGTKLAEVVELLQRDRGATIDELIDATGWLPHTTRAALTGLRKRGFRRSPLPLLASRCEPFSRSERGRPGSAKS